MTDTISNTSTATGANAQQFYILAECINLFAFIFSLKTRQAAMSFITLYPLSMKFRKVILAVNKLFLKINRWQGELLRTLARKGFALCTKSIIQIYPFKKFQHSSS